MATWSLKQCVTSNIIALRQGHNLVGRSKEAQVFLSCNGVSRSHANIFLIEGQLWIQALQTVNGTYVNDNKIPVYIMHKLSPGDQIAFGVVQLARAHTPQEKLCFFQVLQTVDAITSVQDNTNSGPRRSQRCSARRDTTLNDNPIVIESDDEDQKITKPDTTSNPVKTVLADEELVINGGKQDEPVTATTNNPIIIDITDDAEDMDFSCSQILQISQIVNDQVSDDVYQKIKNELAEMDYCNDGVVVNDDLVVDLEEEENCGFQNTQEIFDVLKDAEEPSADKQLLGAIEDLTHLFEDEPVATPPRQSPRKKPQDTNQKNFIKELKRRKKSNSPHVDVDKTLKEERRKKLKELTGSTSSPTPQPNENPIEPVIPSKKRISGQPTVTSVLGIELVETKGRRKSLNTEKRKKQDSPARSRSLTKPVNNHDSAQTRKSLTRECKRLRVQTPSPTNTAEMTRKRGRPRKNEEEPKISMEPLKWQKYDVQTSSYNLRESTEKPKPIAMEPLRWQRYDLEGNSASASTSNMEKATTNLNHVNYHNSMAMNKQNEASKLLMWSNGGPIRKTPTNRRLPEVNDIIRQMVHWIPNRLLEQVQNDVTTPIIKLPKKIPAFFDNFPQYYDTFSKMVLLESWQCLYKGLRESNENPRKMKVQHARVVNDSLVLDCISVISKEDVTRGNYYKPEDFVMLECAMKSKSHVLSLNFGLVQSCRRSLVAKAFRHPINQLLNGPNPHTILEFTVLTRYQPEFELNTKMTHLIKPLINIRTYLMLIRAMKETQNSPLCKMILKPQASDYKFPVTHREVKFPNNNWNAEQKKIVLEAASLCTENRPGIYCVKGPPGTGKSTVIVSLLQQILFAEKHRKDGENPMILLTAPSNTAVDNLIVKIGTARNNLSPELRSKIKLVRIGPESSINKDILNYSLPKLAEKHLPLKLQHHPEIQAAKERKENPLEVAKKVLGDQYQNELRQCEKLIIQKSNIICTTLNSCINARLIDAVNTGLVKFTCCVIDEATQCHEIESLLPVILGIDKFVLVGDPQQLNATIMSREAVKLGFGESLFTRLANNFGLDPRSPIRMLTEQYRMHPEICDFPNKHFYDGKLRTSANPTNKLPKEIRPYLVFNCEKINQSDDYTNMDEVILIKKLLRTIYDMLDRNNSYTVGIITPYNAQKDLLASQIGRLEYCQVTINTVDSFQGSEKDIIIISCVRDSTNSFLQNQNRLNVALTRAKQALYIIGNYSLFKECRLLYDIREDAKRRKVLLDIKQNPRAIDHLKKYLIKTRNSKGEYT